MLILDAYYRVSLSRFIDEVAVQVVEDSLIRHVPTIFSITDVLEVPRNEYSKLVGETDEIRATRERLREKIETINRGSDVFGELLVEASSVALLTPTSLTP